MKIDPTIYNPKIIPENHAYAGKKFTVIRDDKLVGGTKQRGLVPFMENSDNKIFVAYGASTGYAQIALAYAAKLTGKRGVTFIYKKAEDSIATTRLKQLFGSTAIVEIGNHESMDKLREKALLYVTNCTTFNQKPMLLELGISNGDYINYLVASLKTAWPNNFHPARLWLVAGSGTILKALDTILPRTKFIVVQVGRKIWPDQLERADPASPKTDPPYISPLKFYDDVQRNDEPPYDSLLSYDAKLWPFFKKHGKNGDCIFNVAGNSV